MKRLVSVLLALLIITCSSLSKTALADMEKAIEYAKQVQNIINDNEGKGISAIKYLEALNLTIRSHEEFEYGRGLSTLDMMFFAMVYDNLNKKDDGSEQTLAYSMVMELQENTTQYMENLFMLVTKDASKSFENYSFNFDTIKIYIDFVFKYAEAREDYFDAVEALKTAAGID